MKKNEEGGRGVVALGTYRTTTYKFNVLVRTFVSRFEF